MPLTVRGQAWRRRTWHFISARFTSRLLENSSRPSVVIHASGPIVPNSSDGHLEESHIPSYLIGSVYTSHAKVRNPKMHLSTSQPMLKLNWALADPNLKERLASTRHTRLHLDQKGLIRVGGAFDTWI